MNDMLSTAGQPGESSQNAPRASRQVSHSLASERHDLVAIEDTGLCLIDSMTGQALDQIGRDGHIFGAVTAEAIAYISAWAEGGNETTVHEVRSGDPTSTVIGELPGLAVVSGISARGTGLQFLVYPPVLPLALPIEVVERAMPGSHQPSVEARALRDQGAGILTPDGTRWFCLRPIVEGGQAIGIELRKAHFQHGTAPAESGLRLHMSSYHSLLLAPDGNKLYAVDYNDTSIQQQTIHVIDGSGPTLVESIAIQRRPTKHFWCTSVLSPLGDLLFLGSLDGAEGDGIIVYETATWQRVGHLLPTEAIACVIASSDGAMLYATTCDTHELITIEVQTGEELHRVSIDVKPPCPWPFAVVGSR